MRWRPLSFSVPSPPMKPKKNVLVALGWYDPR
ncbi:MAG: hypothetical protein RLZZ399_2916, partial [Verrucomicrobiota bacterium]